MEHLISAWEVCDDGAGIVRGLARGDTYVVVHDGGPVGDLVPWHGSRFVAADLLLERFRGAPSIDRHQFRRDVAV